MTTHTEMTKAKFERIPQHIIDEADSTDIRELAKQRVELVKTGLEFKGPCPLCGGTDRFYVSQDYFGCRKCPQPKTRGAIRFVQWVDRCGFRDAVDALAGSRFVEAQEKRRPVASAITRAKEYDWRQASWQYKATASWQQAHDTLLNSPAGQPGRDYLTGRGIEREAWQVFKLGFAPTVSVPGTQGQQKAPAIAIPWFVGGQLRGIRYRFLEQQEVNSRNVKQTAFYGSQFGSALYGGHALQELTPSLLTLVVVEGELNAISIWQMARDTHLDVLSLGSETARFTPAMVTRASEYRHVIAWLDRAEVARERIEEIPGAYGVRSPDGQDANDLLQSEMLGGFLSAVRVKMAGGEAERQALLWSLWDGCNTDGHIDTGTIQVMQKLADELGLDLDSRGDNKFKVSNNGCR